MIYSVYRLADFDPLNFKNTFKNSILVWVETIELEDAGLLLAHLNANSAKYVVGKDVVVNVPKDTERLSFDAPFKICPIIKPMTKPLPWCSVMQ